MNNGRDNSGKFATGNPGRPKGTPNKSTKEIKDLLNSFISDNLEDLQQQYNELDARDKLQFLERVLKYVLPQQREIQQNIDVSKLSEQELNELINQIIN